MKWTYNIPNKLGTSLLLMGVMALLVFNNLKERSNSEQLKTAFESIYEDRLIVESYILHLADELHQIQELLEKPVAEKDKLLEEKLDKIGQIKALYLNTKLTQTEEERFGHFENLTSQLDQSLSSDDSEAAMRSISLALDDLNHLSEIQVTEAQSLLSQTQRIFSSDSISSQFEIGLVIVIGLMIQGMLFASKTIQHQGRTLAENLN